MRDIEQCPKCKKYFTVEEQFAGFPGCKESEEIYCPHQGCDYYYTRRSNGVFQTYKAEAPEEESKVKSK
jgi:hypothetical protein